MFVWRGNDPNFAHKKIKKNYKTNIVNNFKKLTKRKKGASVEDDILHGEERDPIEKKSSK